MAGDRARVSYDPSRKWRGLIAQQGRVTVEADWNEAAAIDADRARQLTLDAVGTLGTPDGGYVVTAIPATGSPPAGSRAGSPPASGPGDLIIGPGTLYVGGERLDLDAPVAYSAQPDWLDHSTDPRWTPPAVPAGTGYELVYLVAAEQEVSAVEDPALADVALGGPDTMGRRRILQRFVRWPSPSGTGYQAWDAFVASLPGTGLAFDAASMTLGSATTLQVSSPDSGPTSLCQPTATGGYLGSENQMIRVMVTGTDASGAATLVWGFDDASFLYRVQAAAYDASSGNTTVTLASAPPDSYHYPVAGQAVELLRDAVQLTEADYIASPAGFVAPVSSRFTPVSMSLALTGAPPADYLSTTATSQLYLRVWQATASAAPGQLTPLGDTGVQVKLTSSTGTFHPGDFWRFAVRPAQPAAVYPERYLTEGQPPEGPRTLACPVAVLTWEDGAAAVASQVPLFSGLTRQAGGGGDGCCPVTVGPADVDGGATLQALLNQYATQSAVTVCLLPGTYTLPAPLLLGAQSNGLTLQACQGGVVLQGPSQPGSAFTGGLITLVGTTSVTIRGLEISLPLAALPVSIASFPVTAQVILGAYSAGLQAAIGISVGGSVGLTVEDCTFSVGDLGQANVFAAGIFATGPMRGTRITGCTFRCANPPATAPFNELSTVPGANQQPSALPPYQLTFGYLHTGDAAAAQPPVQLLDGAVIERNQFLGVTVPVLAMAQLGSLQLERNTVSGGYGGFWLISLASTAQQEQIMSQITFGNVSKYMYYAGSGVAALADVVILMASEIGWQFPATPGSAPAAGPGVTLQLDLSGNRIDATLGHSYSGAGLVVADLTIDAGSALIHGNRIGTSFPMGAAVLVTGVGEASVTGNVMANEVAPQVAYGTGTEPSYSLVLNPVVSPVVLSDLEITTPSGTVPGDLAGVSAVAVTGNVFVNPTNLPVRPTSFLPPLSDWDTFNTVFGYGIAAPPAVTELFPATAPAGTAVTVTGSSLSGATGVSFGGIPATFTPSSSSPDTELIVTVPTGSGIVDVTVTTAAGTSPTVPADEFTFLAVTSVSPVSGQPPLTVAVAGSGFVVNQTSVSFGSVPGTNVIVTASTELVVLLPAGHGTVDVTVTTPAGTSATSAADQFTYLFVSAVTSPTAYGASPVVTVTGGGFTPDITVIFTPVVSGAPGPITGTNVTLLSSSRLEVTFPASANGVQAGTGYFVTVRTAGGTSPANAFDMLYSGIAHS